MHNNSLVGKEDGPAFVHTDDGELYFCVVYEGIGKYREGCPGSFLLVYRECEDHNRRYDYDESFAKTFRDPYVMNRAKTNRVLANRLLTEIGDWWARLPAHLTATRKAMSDVEEYTGKLETDAARAADSELGEEAEEAETKEAERKEAEAEAEQSLKVVAGRCRNELLWVLDTTEKRLKSVSWLKDSSEGQQPDSSKDLKVGMVRYPNREATIVGETIRLLRHLYKSLEEPDHQATSRIKPSLEHLFEQSWPRPIDTLEQHLSEAWLTDFCAATGALRETPVWDEADGELRFQGRLVCTIAKQARALRDILTAFQENNWSARIEYPPSVGTTSYEAAKALRKKTEDFLTFSGHDDQISWSVAPHTENS